VDTRASGSASAPGYAESSFEVGPGPFTSRARRRRGGRRARESTAFAGSRYRWARSSRRSGWESCGRGHRARRRQRRARTSRRRDGAVDSPGPTDGDRALDQRGTAVSRAHVDQFVRRVAR
jgi:hypothetical protein